MWDRYQFKPGDRVASGDGAWFEVLSVLGAGNRLRVRHAGERVDPAKAGSEDELAVDDVISVSPAPPGPEWERVSVVVHRVRESVEGEAGFEALTMMGVPLGVTVAAFEDTAHEALDRLLRALAAFGFSGNVTVEDVTGLGPSERYEVEV